MNIAKWLFRQGKSVPGSDDASCGRCRWCKKDMCKRYRKGIVENAGFAQAEKNR